MVSPGFKPWARWQFVEKTVLTVYFDFSSVKVARFLLAKNPFGMTIV